MRNWGAGRLSSGRLRALLIFALGTVLALAVTVALPVPALEIRIPGTGARYWLSYGDTLALNYRHSLTRTPVRDEFHLTPGGELILKQVDLTDLAPGWPDTVQLTAAGGLMIQTRSRFAVLRVRVGWGACQRLVTGNSELWLLALAPPGELVEIRGLRAPRFLRWLYRPSADAPYDCLRR